MKILFYSFLGLILLMTVVFIRTIFCASKINEEHYEESRQTDDTSELL